MGSFRPAALFLLVFWLLVLGLAGARVLLAESRAPAEILPSVSAQR